MTIITNFEIFTLQREEIAWLLIEKVHEQNNNIKMNDS